MDKETEFIKEFGGLCLKALYDYRKWFDVDDEDYKFITEAINKLEEIE